MLTKRQQMIVKVLLEKEQSTSKAIAETLSLSDKTVLNELTVIDQELKKRKYGRLIKSRGVGIRLLIEDAVSKQKLEEACYQISVDDDVSHLLKRLFMGPKKTIVTEKKLKRELYVSRSYLAHKIEDLNQICHDYHVMIKRVKNYGLVIEGSEFDIRDAIIELFLKTYLFPTQVAVGKHFFNEKQEYSFKSVFGEFNYHPIEQLILGFEKKNQLKLDHFSRNTVLLHISLAIIREKLGYKLTYTRQQKELIASFPKMFLNELGQFFKENYTTEPSKTELSYIYLYLDLYGLLTSNSFDKKKLEVEKSERFNEFIDNFLSITEGILNIDIGTDKQLKKGIVHHLSGTILRLTMSIRIHNPLLYEVKKNFSMVYKATWASSLLFDQYYNATINEDEIAYIALYLGIAKEKRKQNINICLLVNGKNSFSELLYEQIRNLHPRISLSCQTTEEYQDVYDIVVSPLMNVSNYTSKKVIHIGRILTENDKIAVLSTVKELIKKKILGNKKRDVNEAMGLKEEFIFLDYPSKEKNTIITEICRLLERKGYVYKNYIQSVIKREVFVSTEIGSAVAIPHGNSKLVKKSIIVYINLQEPIQWTEADKVKHIFFLVVSEINDFTTEKTIRGFYKTLIKITEDGSITLLNQLKTKQEVIEFFVERGN
ncbi:BglG family transcription antiterminator [Enterococcus sp. CWB-B31]|uniref:BglG family transcription antiterminator n=1 Tax=Enterococcus sp. CWB-B31 TaxID=2885159 RepID=UPI001E2C19E9|nr:PTS sugar transporter subunit IIA [Enterococcus sp. CWB-B31]MCB5954161.1 PTS sugar transporter subunit IIA [Enterococcus sp. CWB-B31]